MNSQSELDWIKNYSKYGSLLRLLIQDGDYDINENDLFLYLYVFILLWQQGMHNGQFFSQSTRY